MSANLPPLNKNFLMDSILFNPQNKTTSLPTEQHIETETSEVDTKEDQQIDIELEIDCAEFIHALAVANRELKQLETELDRLNSQAAKRLKNLHSRVEEEIELLDSTDQEPMDRADEGISKASIKIDKLRKRSTKCKKIIIYF